MMNRKVAFGSYQCSDAYTAVAAAIQTGYRVIDTAKVYKNEEAVGKAIHEAMQKGIPRSEIFVTSKVNARMHGLKDTPKAIRQSLNKLDLQYIDLYLLHDAISGHERRIQAYRGLLKAKERGQITQAGVSNWSVKHLTELEEAGLPLPYANQIELHPWCQQRDIVAYCTAKDIAIQAYCPLVRGQRFDDKILQAICQDLGKTPAQILLRWSLQHGFLPVVKSDNADRIGENFRVFDFELSQDHMTALDALDQGSEGACSWNPVDCA